MTTSKWCVVARSTGLDPGFGWLDVEPETMAKPNLNLKNDCVSGGTPPNVISGPILHNNTRCTIATGFQSERQRGSDYRGRPFSVFRFF